MANTSLLGLLLPTTGTLNGTWGSEFNAKVTELLDSAIAGTTELTADTDEVLTDTITAANEARQPILLCTGARTAVRTISPPLRSKTYVVVNSTTGGYGVTIGSVTVPAGKACLVVWDGSAFVPASDYVPVSTIDTLTLTNPLSVASGGTGVDSFAGPGIVVTDGSSPLAVISAPTGNVVGTTDEQTLTNKTISADDNTLSGVAAESFVLSNADGEIDGTAAQKAIPDGVVVGTTDEQTLTNKTISVDANTISGIAGSSFVLANADGEIDGDAGQKAIPSGAVVGTSDTQTLTNKRVNPRSSTGTTTDTLVVDADDYDQTSVTALAEDLDVAAPVGTPVNGQKLLFRIKDDGTARTLTWNSIFREIGAYLPAATTASKTVYVGCIYNATDTKWDVVAVTTEV